MPHPPNIHHHLGVTYNSAELKAQAEQLADRLGIPLTENEKEYDFTLSYSAQGMELRYTKDPSLTGSFRVDFITGASGFRRKQGRHEMLVRAMGHGKNRPTHILDATGGTGRDAFVLACNGYHVQIFEQNLIIAALLDDGLQRASKEPDTKEIIERIELTEGNSCNLLISNPEKLYDVIYLDPMFPVRNKSSRVKKELQMLQLLIGHDDKDTEKLMSIALQYARNRVVVKRPKSAPALSALPPSFSLNSKKIRFDIYLTGSELKMNHTDRQRAATPD